MKTFYSLSYTYIWKLRHVTASNTAYQVLHAPAFVSLKFTSLPVSTLFCMKRHTHTHTHLDGRDGPVVVCWQLTIWQELCTSYSSSCHHSPPLSPLASTISRTETSHAGSGVVRTDPLRFLARCGTRRLNEASSVFRFISENVLLCRCLLKGPF